MRLSTVLCLVILFFAVIDQASSQGPQEPDYDYEPDPSLTPLQILNSGYRRCDESGRAFCPETNTCCHVGSSEWRCCPLAAATCCADRSHCCPRHMTCHRDTPKCRYGKYALFWAFGELAYAAEVEAAEDAILCPGEKLRCRSSDTCCDVGNSTYGCCPYSGAICCEDRVNCCPRDTSCDVLRKRCVPKADQDVGTNLISLH